MGPEQAALIAWTKCVKSSPLTEIDVSPSTEEPPGYTGVAMVKAPPVHELEFLKISGNHAEYVRKLGVLGIAAVDIQAYAQHVATAWFRLGETHLHEAAVAAQNGCPRSAYSRAYYGAYNVSKGLRYLANGFVSLKGDDHGNASTQLPSDFPQVDVWSSRIATLYEHRLRADYDNWNTTMSEFTLQVSDALDLAQRFTDEARNYMNTKYGMSL